MRSVMVMLAGLLAVSAPGCNFTVTKHEQPDYNGDGRYSFADHEAPRSNVDYDVPTDTRTADERLDDHMDRQKGGDEYERNRRD